MIITVLGLLDIIAGLILIVGGLPFFPGHGLVITIAAALIIKGVFSWLSNLAAGDKGLKIDPMGILDIFSGMLLISIYSGVFMFFYTYFGIILVILGIYSFVVGLIK